MSEQREGSSEAGTDNRQDGRGNRQRRERSGERGERTRGVAAGVKATLS